MLGWLLATRVGKVLEETLGLLLCISLGDSLSSRDGSSDAIKLGLELSNKLGVIVGSSLMLLILLIAALLLSLFPSTIEISFNVKFELFEGVGASVDIPNIPNICASDN